MSDTTATTTEATTTDTTTAPATTTTDPAQGTDWKAEARKWEARAKANHDAVTELDALKTKAAEDAKTLEELRAKVAGFEHATQVDAWKKAAVEGTQIPVDALRGDTEEEIKAHAEVLKGIVTATPVVGATGITGKSPEGGLDPSIETVRALFGTGK